uniref:C2H2-type domain-containing protein n=2 Tax=Panagrolaimus TaxID=55784 RepID=A0A914ZB11_9BILA
MFGATTPFNAQTLATMFGFQQSQLSQLPPLPQQIIPQMPSPKLSPDTNFLASLIQEASKFQQQQQQSFLPSLQDLIIQNTFLNLLQAQISNNANAKIASSPPPPPPPAPVPQQFIPTQSTISSSPGSRSSPQNNESRKRPNSSISSSNNRKSTFDDSDSVAAPAPKRTKQMRKLASEDAETNSPVSGMHIKDMSEVSADDIAKAAELDETASFVVVSEETRRKLAEIPDVIKSTNCALCKVKFDDVIHLARHKCPRIVHEEYKCSECEKVS